MKTQYNLKPHNISNSEITTNLICQKKYSITKLDRTCLDKQSDDGTSCLIFQGHRGLQGPRGEKGDIGEAGEDGLPGTPGTHGRPGNRGEKGKNVFHLQIH